MPGSKETYRETPVVPMGKEKIFDYFFRQYYAMLCFFAESIIRNEEDAKDIVQDCFVKLWHDAAITEKAASVKSFLYTMVRNRCIDYIRKQKVRTKVAPHLQTKEEDFEYFDELAFAEMMRQLLDHIEELPSHMRTILRKYYLQGKKHKEIAKELSTTTNAVKLQKSRAIKLLKQKLLFVVSILLIFFKFFLNL